MKSVCSKGLTLLLAAVLVLALGGCGNGKGYLPSQNATWGELCRHFQPEWFDSLPNEVQEEYDQILLKEALTKLNDREKTILTLRFFQGKTQVEVAQEIGISQAQVSRLEKAALEQFRHK